MTSDERSAYEAVERYIRDTYNQASPEDSNAVGFVMTIYRKRLASSFYVLKQTLRKRRAKVYSGGKLPEHCLLTKTFLMTTWMRR